MKMLTKRISLPAILVLVFTLGLVQAAPPTTLDYQGFLTDCGGEIPGDGSVTLSENAACSNSGDYAIAAGSGATLVNNTAYNNCSDCIYGQQ